MSGQEPRVLQSSTDFDTRPEAPSPLTVFTRFVKEQQRIAGEHADAIESSKTALTEAKENAKPAAVKAAFAANRADIDTEFSTTTKQITDADARIKAKISELKGMMSKLTGGSIINPGPLTQAKKKADAKRRALQADIDDTRKIVSSVRDIVENGGVSETEKNPFDFDGDGDVDTEDLAGFEGQLQEKMDALENDPVIVLYNTLQARYDTFEATLNAAQEKFDSNEDTLKTTNNDWEEALDHLRRDIKDLRNQAVQSAQTSYDSAVAAKNEAVAPVAAKKWERVGEETSDLVQLSTYRVGDGLFRTFNTCWGVIKGLGIGLAAVVATPFVEAYKGATTDTAATRAADKLYERRRESGNGPTTPSA